MRIIHKINSNHISAVILLTAMSVASVIAQSVAFKIPITIKDNRFGKADMNMGIHPQATYCLDDTLDNFRDRGTIVESWLPPINDLCDTCLDARFVDPRGFNGDCLDLGTLDNIHSFVDTNQVDTFQIQTFFKSSTGYPITVSWPSNLSYYCDSMRLKDIYTGTIYNVNMLTQSSFALTYSSGVFYKFVRIIVYGPKQPPPPPAAPTLNSPTNNSTEQPLTINFNWSASSGATLYRFEVATDSLFKSLYYSDTLSATSKQLGGFPQDKKYFWHVSGIGIGEGWFQDPPFRFTTLLDLPNSPTLDSPATGSINLPTNPKLKWSKVGYTDSYHLQLATDQNFGSIAFDYPTLTDTFKQMSGLSNCATYYWRVRAKNRTGYSSYSDTFNFTITKAIPAVPNLLLPASNATGVLINPTMLSWSGDFCSDNYTLQVKKQDSTGGVIFDGVVTSTSQQINNLEQAADYYWRVKATNTSQGSSNFSSYRKFTTILLPPAQPTLLSPPTGVETVSVNATLKWHKVLYTVKYYLEVSLAQNFTQSIISDSSITDTVFQTQALQNCTKYYWRLRGINNAGLGTISEVRNYKVKEAVPSAPSLLNPPHGEDSVSYTPILSWNSADPCTKIFRLQVAKDVNFNTKVFNDTTRQTSKQVGPLERDMNYYWRVSDSNATGTSPWSSTFQFKTTPYVPPGIPTLVSPINNQTGVFMTPTLQWTADVMAEMFRLQVASDQSFLNLIIDDTTISTTSKQVGPLQHSTLHYWRVNARNGAGTSTWTTEWKFTTLYLPSTPVIISPLNGQTNVALNPTFTWQAAERADVYQMQVARDSQFSSLVFNDSTITGTSKTLTQPLRSYVQYCWRVRAKNNAGLGPWSLTAKFTTIPTEPAEWTIPIAVKETGPIVADTIEFGMDIRATSCIDYELGEFVLPPVDFGDFDVRFIGQQCLGEGVSLNVVQFRNYFQIDTLRILFQTSMIGSYPVKFSWSKNIIRTLSDSMLLIDEFGGLYVRTRMDQDTSVLITNSSVTSLILFICGPKPYPQGIKYEKDEKPIGYYLYPNYPNPFNPSTEIKFSTENTANIRIAVFNILGQEIIEITDELYNPGVYSFLWNGMDYNGNQVPTGVYYLQLIAANSIEKQNYFAQRSMIFMK